MSNVKKLMMTAAGGEALNVEDVFSTYLYEGDASNPRTITNGIDLSGEGGLTIIKRRDGGTQNWGWWDTERGPDSFIKSNGTNTENTTANVDLTDFNSDGFTLGPNHNLDVNSSGGAFCSWSFRKAPKFLDIVQYTGNGLTSQTISHNLGSAPGMMLIKCLNNNYSWAVYHREMYETGHYSGSTDPTDFYMLLNGGGKPGYTTGSGFWGNTQPTATEFTVGDNALTNVSGGDFVAYLFAHNNSDGEFGPTGDQDIIKCGRYQGDSTNNNEIDLGFEPQFLLLLEQDNNDSRRLLDTSRGMPIQDGFNSRGRVLFPNNSDADATNSVVIEPYQSGFRIRGATLNTSGDGYCYVAIRRGPMGIPDDATKVFKAASGENDATAPYDAYIGNNYLIDMSMQKYARGATGSFEIIDRYRMQTNGETRQISTDNNNQQSATFDGGYEYKFDRTGTIGLPNRQNISTAIGYLFSRAPGFFDMLAWYGDGTTSRTIPHNLGVIPEMIWIKNTSYTLPWVTGSVFGASDYEQGTLSNDQRFTNTSYSGTAAFASKPTATSLELGSYFYTNANGYYYSAYLFGSTAGVSKVGTYVGNGSSQTIDCGFSNGARFVMIKSIKEPGGGVSGNGNWHVWDTNRGIAAGNDAYLELDVAASQNTSYDSVDPNSSGFGVVQNTNTNINVNTHTYLFFAIA